MVYLVPNIMTQIALSAVAMAHATRQYAVASGSVVTRHR